MVMPSSLRMNPYLALTGGSRGGRGPPLSSRGLASIRASRSSAFNRLISAFSSLDEFSAPGSECSVRHFATQLPTVCGTSP